ncbi:MAG: hypothetical protein ACRDWS_11315 [Acidimicrobiia bacterium]
MSTPTPRLRAVGRDKLRPWFSEVRRQGLGFTLVVLVILGLFGFIGAVLFLPDLAGGLVGPTAAAHTGQHFRIRSHRVHDLTFSFLFATAIVGLLAQLRAPSKNVAGQLMALIPWVGLALVIPLTDYWIPPGTGFQIIATVIFGGLTLGATMLHPAGRHLFGSFRMSRANRVMLALVVIAAVPLLAYASTNIGLQRTAASGNEHFDLGHYGFMAAFSLTVLGVGLLASLRPDGWRLTAWVAGLLPALLGVTSLVYTDIGSSLSPGWAVAAIAWGIVFVTAAQLTRDTERPPPLSNVVRRQDRHGV